MTIHTIKDRINSYRDAANHRLMRKLPVIITLNGRGFARVTSGLDKPYSSDFSEAMCATAIKLCHEVDGAVFAYLFSDEITIVARNDQSNETQPWFQNDVQKVASVSSSLATMEFHRAAQEWGLRLIGDASFVANVYAVPNITETINLLIHKQQIANASALNFATYYHLVKTYGDDALDILRNRTQEEKEEILKEYDAPLSYYPTAFRRGIACYRAPLLVPTREGKVLKNKWIVNNDLPIFTQDHTFLQNLFKAGTDIVRVGDI